MGPIQLAFAPGMTPRNDVFNGFDPQVINTYLAHCVLVQQVWTVVSANKRISLVDIGQAVYSIEDDWSYFCMVGQLALLS